MAGSFGDVINSFNGKNNSIDGLSGHTISCNKQGQQGSSSTMDWTHQEQALLEDGLILYASESTISLYAKLAVQLKDKTVRDVALRCKWTTKKKENNKRRKDDLNILKKIKDRKEKLIEPAANSTSVMIQPGYAPYAQGVDSNNGNGLAMYDAKIGATTQLIHHNARVFEQISANLVTRQIHENTGLLCQARDNIFKILQKLNESSDIQKQMPPLTVMLNVELANTILPPLLI